MTDTEKLAEPSPKAGGELAEAAREELRAAFMDVQRIKRSGPIEDEGVLPPIWRAINAIPAALYHLDKMAEFESDLAAEDDATRTPEQPDRNAVLELLREARPYVAAMEMEGDLDIFDLVARIDAALKEPT